jgi:hypothetical protein
VIAPAGDLDHGLARQAYDLDGLPPRGRRPVAELTLRVHAHAHRVPSAFTANDE